MKYLYRNKNDLLPPFSFVAAAMMVTASKDYFDCVSISKLCGAV
ncbi:unnamed protein product [Amoebophrya sp. A120]|nr:unnamed protein product [Amoebophrya sp. A120]|eukprot:GSA120T00017338001.1